MAAVNLARLLASQPVDSAAAAGSPTTGDASARQGGDVWSFPPPAACAVPFFGGGAWSPAPQQQQQQRQRQQRKQRHQDHHNQQQQQPQRRRRQDLQQHTEQRQHRVSAAPRTTRRDWASQPGWAPATEAAVGANSSPSSSSPSWVSAAGGAPRQQQRDHHPRPAAFWGLPPAHSSASSTAAAPAAGAAEAVGIAGGTVGRQEAPSSAATVAGTRQLSQRHAPSTTTARPLHRALSLQALPPPQNSLAGALPPSRSPSSSAVARQATTTSPSSCSAPPGVDATGATCDCDGTMSHHLLARLTAQIASLSRRVAELERQHDQRQVDLRPTRAEATAAIDPAASTEHPASSSPSSFSSVGTSRAKEGDGGTSRQCGRCFRVFRSLAGRRSHERAGRCRGGRAVVGQALRSHARRLSPPPRPAPPTAATAVAHGATGGDGGGRRRDDLGSAMTRCLRDAEALPTYKLVNRLRHRQAGVPDRRADRVRLLARLMFEEETQQQQQQQQEQQQEPEGGGDDRVASQVY